jgi:hypothetical protein
LQIADCRSGDSFSHRRLAIAAFEIDALRNTGIQQWNAQMPESAITR